MEGQKDSCVHAAIYGEYEPVCGGGNDGIEMGVYERRRGADEVAVVAAMKDLWFMTRDPIWFCTFTEEVWGRDLRALPLSPISASDSGQSRTASSHRLTLSDSKALQSFCHNMHALLIASEESHIFLLRLFNSSFQTLDSIKDRIYHIFADFICKKSDIDLIHTRHYELLPCSLQKIIANVGNRYQQRKKEWLSQKKGFDGKGEPEAAFNVIATDSPNEFKKILSKVDVLSPIMKKSSSPSSLSLELLQVYISYEVSYLQIAGKAYLGHM
ncbi:hypothetical protein RJ639_030298 [Escallonia herrerae]|uniref:Uncharacterized protein n=1 Tax=Escallonia herrerae TaxID=1293975 RepID=A0AA89BNL6_9ASTE|nr:hypothetical protein RJ639_030298 [Escallonia herrerae]